MKSPYDVIIKPIITEKTMANTEAGKYTFVVAPDAEKPEIKAAAEKLFGVKVLSVNVANFDGKVKRLRNKPGKTAAYKKAVVTIATEGKDISYLGKGGKAVKSGAKYKTSIEEFGFGQ